MRSHVEAPQDASCRGCMLVPSQGDTGFLCYKKVLRWGSFAVGAACGCHFKKVTGHVLTGSAAALQEASYGNCPRLPAAI